MTAITYQRTPLLARVGSHPPKQSALQVLADLDAQRARYERVSAKPRHNGARRKEAVR